MCHWIYSVLNLLHTWGVPLSRRDCSFLYSVRISVKIFTGKELVFNERKDPSSVSGKVQFAFGSGFYGVFDLFVLKLWGF